MYAIILLLLLLLLTVFIHYLAFWSEVNNQRSFFINYATQHSFDPLVSDHWYSQPRDKIMATKVTSSSSPFLSSPLLFSPIYSSVIFLVPSLLLLYFFFLNSSFSFLKKMIAGSSWLDGIL